MANLNLDKIDLGSLGLNEDHNAQLNANISEAVKTDPDKHAKIRKLSKESGVPTFAVESKPEQVEQRLKLSKIDIDSLTKNSPKTSKFLSGSFDNAVIAQEDVASNLLSGIEETFRGLGGAIATGFEAQLKGLELRNLEKEIQSLQAQPSFFGVEIDPDLAYAVGEGFNPQVSREEMIAAKKEASDRLIGEIQALQKDRQALTPEDLNIVQEGIRAGVESIANMAPGIALTVLSRGRTAPLLFTMGAQTFSGSYGEGRAEGLTPEEAGWYASIDAAIEVGTEILPTGVLERVLTGQSKGIKKDALKFAVREMGTEQLATALQTVNSYMFGLDEQLENATSASEVVEIQMRRQVITAIATVVAGGSQIAAATAVNKTLAKIEQRENEIETKSSIEQQSIDKISSDALSSKLRERDPETFKQFIRDVDGEQNTHVFVDGVQTSLYLRGKTREEINRDPALKILDNAMQESRATGSDVAIPVDQFMGDVVGTEAYESLREHMTMSPETVSPFRQEQHKVETENYIAKMMNEANENASEYVEAQEIYTKVRDQLIDTGVVSPANASTMAQIVPAWATAQAKRRGRSVQEVYESAGLTIEGPQTGERARLEGEQVLTQEGPSARGYYDPANSIIRLTESSDLSTFMHEFAHFMYEMETKTESDLSRRISNWYKRNKADVAEEATKYLLGQHDPAKQGRKATDVSRVSSEDVVKYIDTGTTGNQDLDATLRRATHEQFARGFETYLMEGKAPSIELRNVFRAFARWLSQIYQAFRGNLNVNLDNEMRQVFDRLLATEEQISAAEARARVEPLFTDAAMAGMTEEEFTDYQTRQEKVKDVQSETLRDQLMEALTRKTRKWWNEEKADVKDEVLSSVSKERVYVTINRLKDGDIKLDHATVKGMVGEERTDKLGRKSVHVPVAFRGMTAKGQLGVHPDEAAALMGYSSGAEMVADIRSAPALAAKVEARAEEIMVERYGDPFTDGTIEQLADEAVANEERGKLILHELKILSRGTNQRSIERQVMKSLAEDYVGKLSFREIHPGKYRKAEIQAAQESSRMLAEGNRDGAAQAKQRQALNFYLGMAATDAKSETTKIVDRMARYSKKKVREEIQKAEGGYWEQITKILERFEFRKSATLRQVGTVNQDINTWMAERIDADGDGLVLHNAVLNESYVTHWKNVAFSDLKGIDDSVRNIEHVARYSNKLTRLGEEIEYGKLVSKLVDAAAATGTGRFKKSASVADDLSWVQRKGRWAMAQMTKIPYMMSWMDGLDRVGTWFTTFSQPMTDAYSAELELFNEVGKPVVDLIQNRSKEDMKRMNTTYFIPEIKGTAGGTHTGNLKGHEIIAVALNTGNESNLRKLLLGEQWAQEDGPDININNTKLQAVLKHMTESDWNVVQTIWDQIDILYPKLAEVHRRTTGLTPPKVDATPVETPFGTFRGGYYPVKYDPTRSNRAADFEERKEAEVSSMFSGNASIQASVNASATSERTGYFAPLHLTLNVVPNHIQETIHYITHHDAVREVNKLLRDPRIKDAVVSKLGPEEFAQLKPWLNDIAKDGRNAPNKSIVDAAFNQLRLGTTLGVMGFKASTGIIQISGLSNSIAEVGVGPMLQSMRTILGGVDSMRSAWDFASSNSKVLKHRAKTMDRELMNALKQLESRRGVLAAVQEASMKHIALIQTYMVDLPSWHAAYTKELGESGDEVKAYQYADWVIENVQGSGVTKDMAGLMRNQTKTHTIFTMFMTFFSSLWNLQRDLVKGAQSGKYSTTTVAAKAMFLFTIPVLFEMLMRGEFSKEDQEPEELLQETLTKVALYPIASIPFVRDAANGLFSGYQYNASPVTSIVEQGLQGLRGAGKAVLSDGELTKGQIKSISKLAGAAAGVPGTGQAWATGEHLYEVLAEGEELTMHQLLFGPERK